MCSGIVVFPSPSELASMQQAQGTLTCTGKWTGSVASCKPNALQHEVKHSSWRTIEAHSTLAQPSWQNSEHLGWSWHHQEYPNALSGHNQTCRKLNSSLIRPPQMEHSLALATATWLSTGEPQKPPSTMLLKISKGQQGKRIKLTYIWLCFFCWSMINWWHHQRQREWKWWSFLSATDWSQAEPCKWRACSEAWLWTVESPG